MNPYIIELSSKVKYRYGSSESGCDTKHRICRISQTYNLKDGQSWDALQYLHYVSYMKSNSLLVEVVGR